MTKKTFNPSHMMRAATLLLLAMLCFNRVKADELTVYDGTVTNNRVPMFALYFDDFSRSQFVIPAADLTAMEGGTITSITYHTSSSSSGLYQAYTTLSTVDIYLTEIESTTLSAFVPKSSTTIVYQGTLSFTAASSTVGNGTVTITLSTPYTYDGGNLLVGCENTTDAGYKGITFLGETVNGASLSGNNSSSLDNITTASQQNFIPKTTFTYEEGNTSCPKPTNMTASVTNSHTATVTWESDFTSFNLRFKVSGADNWTEVNNLTTKTYTFTTLSPEASYQVQVQAIGNNETSNWTSVSFSTPESMPAPSALTCTAYASTYATLAWTQNGDETYWQICLDDDETNLITVSQNPYMLTKIAAGHDYIAKVRAVTSTGDEYSAWSNVISFTPIDELTVYDGTESNSNIPMNVYSMNSYTRSQFIIPATELTAMTDCNISSVKFYLKPSISHNTLYTTSYTFDIYLKEVDNTGISAFVDKASATVVYSNTVAFPTDNVVTINFATPFEYNGGNLLIGCENAAKNGSEYESFYYYGETVSGASVYQDTNTEQNLSSLPPTQANFIPKTTFSYEKPTSLVRIPTNLTATHITPHSAKLKWKSNFDRFNLRYKISTEEEWTEVNSLLAKSYTLTDLRSSTLYDVQVQTIGINETSEWVSTSFETTAMPAPTILFCMTTTGNTATLSWLKHGDESAWEICLDGDEENLINVTEIPYTLTGLTTGQEYTAKVRAAKGTDHSAWTDAINFTTADLLALTPPVIEDYEGIYDGEGHTFRVVSNPSGATLRFGYGPNTCDRTAAQMGYRTNAGSHPFYWQASKEGYATLTGCVQVIIHKAKGTIDFAEKNIDRFGDDEPFTNPLTFTGDGTVTYSSHNPDAATIDPTTGEVTIHGVGWTEITATVTDEKTTPTTPKRCSTDWQ